MSDCVESLLHKSPALFSGFPLDNICKAAIWSMPLMFIKDQPMDVDSRNESAVWKAVLQSVIWWSVHVQLLGKKACYSAMWDCAEAIMMKTVLSLRVTVVHRVVFCECTHPSLLSLLRAALLVFDSVWQWRENWGKGIPPYIHWNKRRLLLDQTNRLRSH